MTFRSRPHIVIALACTTVMLGIIAAPNVNAQTHPIEVYGGYSLLHPRIPVSLTGNASEANTIQSVLGNLSGWNGGVTIGLTNSFSAVADLSGYYKNLNTTVEGDRLDGSLRAYTFVFGPQYTWRGEKLQPFARGLFGVAHGSAEGSVNGDSGSGSKNVFNASVGGGLDVKVSPRISIRPASFDYFPFRSSDGGGLTFNNFRYGAGVVFHVR